MAEKKKAAAPAAAVATDKKKALETALAQIEKNYGKGAIMRLGDDIAVNVEAIPTGSLSLDLALGIGGVPRGRIVEIYGPESCGKTTLALHIVASAQNGGEAAYIDVEHALEPAYARALGVDIDNLLISQPDTGEQALDITEALVRSGAVDVVVVDSVAALLPRSELEGEMGESSVGVVARLMSQALRKLQDEYRRHLHQPAAREDRRYVRQPRNDAGRPRAQILLERPHRHAPHRNAQIRHGNGGQPHPRQGHQE